MSFITNKQDGLSHSQIILKHLQKILEMSTIEFRSGFHEKIYQGNTFHVVYHPSTIKGYFQAIDALADVLKPFFDEQMSKVYDELMKNSSGLREKFEKDIGDKLFKAYEKRFELEVAIAKRWNNPEPSEEEWEKKYLTEKATKIEDISQKEIDAERILIYRQIFQELNLLLKRKDYLKGVTISEELDEDGEVEEQE